MSCSGWDGGAARVPDMRRRPRSPAAMAGSPVLKRASEGFAAGSEVTLPTNGREIALAPAA